jgi:hypothetical protein
VYREFVEDFVNIKVWIKVRDEYGFKSDIISYKNIKPSSITQKIKKMIKNNEKTLDDTVVY